MAPQPLSLKQLEATFIVAVDNGWEDVPTLSAAQGVSFLCPKCFAANGGRVGTHMVVCWFNGRGVKADQFPLPGRWNPRGSGLGDLTFVGPGSTSVKLNGGCGWHGYITKGVASILPQ